MNRERLISNIIDQMKEGEIKIGYAKGTVRLYYPAESLAALLEIPAEAPGTTVRMLTESGEFEETVLGRVQFAERMDRVEASISPVGAEYVHALPEPPFLRDVVEFFRHHMRCGIAEVEQLFAKYSPEYVCKPAPEGLGFSYVLYFENGDVDPYYYCITDEMGHMTYHRFTKQDYEMMLK